MMSSAKKKEAVHRCIILCVIYGCDVLFSVKLAQSNTITLIEDDGDAVVESSNGKAAGEEGDNISQTASERSDCRR